MRPERLQLRQLQQEISDIERGAAYAIVDALIEEVLDHLKPYQDISTHEVAVKDRYLQDMSGNKIRYDESKTPFAKDIHDACDHPDIRIVAVKGPARGTKTTSAENLLLKIGKYGPRRNVLWFMHTEPDVKRYVRERVEFFLREHEELWAKYDNKTRPAWNMKIIDGMLWEYAPANPSTTRGRSAALIVADEIDAMRKDIRAAIITLIKNRQREFGNLAKAFVCSHPDQGPLEGIDAILRDSDQRQRYWWCFECGFMMGPAAEIEQSRRVTWNIPQLMKQGIEMPRDELLDFVKENVSLSCPNCRVPIDNKERLALDAHGRWMGNGQFIENEEIEGELKANDIAGFTIHAFMAPFFPLQDAARDFAEATLTFRETRNDSKLKEETVKTLGETYKGDDPASQVKEWKLVKVRLRDTGYKMGTIPRGVEFLTAMVDVQGDRFEAGVIGWNRHRESWLIDRFSIKQRLGLKNIKPADSLEDWDAIESAVIHQVYPFAHDPEHGMMIGKISIDTGGAPGVTQNARTWAANLLGRAENPLEQWRLILQQGDAWDTTAKKKEKASDKTRDLYGSPPRALRTDTADQPLLTTIYERTPNVTQIKRILSFRMAIENPGAGRMHLPSDIEDHHVRELTAETYINGVWMLTGGIRNETWDIWVGCEVGRALLAPDDETIAWGPDGPIWQRALPMSPDSTKDATAEAEMDFFSRLRRLNRPR